MSEEQAEYSVKEELELQHRTAASEVESLPRALDRKGVSLSPTGLFISPDMPYGDFSRMIKYMNAMSYGQSVKDCLFKFYLGDALNQGNDIYGDKMEQVLANVHWAYGYIENIRWVARQVPPENRSLKVSTWKVWCQVAILDQEDQKHWVEECLEEMRQGGDWYVRLDKRIEGFRKEKEIKAIEDPEFREEVKELAKYNDASVKEVREWKRKGKTGRRKKTAGEWWGDALDEIGWEGENRQMVFNLAMQFVDEIRDKNIKAMEKMWKMV
jgi:hypothetical protein